MKHAHPFLSLVIPVHNEESNLTWHHKEIQQAFADKPFTYEIVYVDDGSTDNSLTILKELAAKDTAVHYLSFSRNFGKEAATTAGLQKAKGDAVILMDGDGQHPLSAIDDFITQWDAGYEVVIGVREANKGEGFIAKAGSRLFYALLKSLDSGQEVVSKSTDFRLIDRKVLDEFNKLTERNRIARNLIDWLGYKRAYVPFEALERHGGAPSYSFNKRFKLALDGMVKHSTKPLKFIGGLGVFISTLSAVAFLAIIIEMYLLSDPLNLAITGTAILGLLLSFMCGIILSCQGLLALYLENVFHETQNRPLFIVSEEA
jgi:glycosyltransferase involved in cell wall biosynthesis